MNSSMSTRQKIGTLIKRFLRYLDDNKNTIFNISNLLQQAINIFKQNKKALDMIFYFEGLGLLLRISSDHIVYLGYKGMTRKMHEFENQIPICKPPKAAQQINILGRPTSIKLQNQASFLIGKIFFTLIYKKEVLSKSSVEQLAQSYISQQKQLNSKNFVPDILTILSTLNLVEKNQSNESLSYTGPDLKIYDENNRKISWKIYQIMRRQQVALGKQISAPILINQRQDLKVVQNSQGKVKNSSETHNYPNPYHISYFPQLSYAVLRSSSWQKFINKTIFFIGRKQKSQNKSRSYQVDLQLTDKAVSRQHAVIAYNFETGKWEIRCLSKRNNVKVDGERIVWGDHNVWLKNKSEVSIGSEKFVFVQAMKLPQKQV